MGFFEKLFKKKDDYIPVNSKTSFQPAPAVTNEPQILKTQNEKGETIAQVIIPALQNGFPRYVNIIGTDITYDTETEEGINYIKEELDQQVNIPGYEHSIEYYLQRKATELKHQKKLDLSILCLQKANAIMALNTNYYALKEFLRLPEYLKKAGRFDEAKKEEENIENLFSGKKYLTSFGNSTTSSSLQTELIQILRGWKICGNCAKYHDRIYSKCEQDIRFPSYNFFDNYMAQKTCDCQLNAFPFRDGISIMRGLGEKDPIGYSNRPFEDDRTPEEKAVYEQYIQNAATEKKNRADYDWIREFLPDIAPKSFGGYMRMKNSNSNNYKKIVEAAKDQDYPI